MKHISFSSLIFKEGETYLAYCPQLDLSSCGASVDHARKMLREAVWLFVEEAEKMGTLRQILEEAHHHCSSYCALNRTVRCVGLGTVGRGRKGTCLARKEGTDD